MQEEGDAAVEEGGLDELGLHEDGVVQDVELVVQSRKDVGLLRSELFLSFQYGARILDEMVTCIRLIASIRKINACMQMLLRPPSRNDI